MCSLFLRTGMVAGSDSVIKLKVSSAVCIRNADYDGTSCDPPSILSESKSEIRLTVHLEAYLLRW